MVSNRLYHPIRLALVAVAVGVLAGCASTDDRHYDDGYIGHDHYDYYEPPYYAPHVHYYDYWYYPHAGFYYDPRVRVYIYQEHDRWVRARALPRHLHAYPGRHVIVRAPRDRPYADYPRHRDRFTPERYRPDGVRQPHFTPPSLQRHDQVPPADAAERSPIERLRDRQRSLDDPRDGRYEAPVRELRPERRSPPAVHPGGGPAPGHQPPRKQLPAEPEDRPERRGPLTPVPQSAPQSTPQSAPQPAVAPRDVQWRNRFKPRSADGPDGPDDAGNRGTPGPTRRMPGASGPDEE